MKDHNAAKAIVVILVVICFVIGIPGHLNLCDANPTQSRGATGSDIGHKNNFMGAPQENRPKVPKDSGFWSFAIPVPKIISRSGQPSLIGFRWLKVNGWKGIIDLRLTDDAKWRGFQELHFNYLSLPIKDDFVPSDVQAQKFLEFVSNPSNQPVHIHCFAGVGRTGVMIALYRFMIQGWPMDKAINEARHFNGGINKIQEDWLKGWALAHAPGSYSLKKDAMKSK